MLINYYNINLFISYTYTKQLSLYFDSNVRVRFKSGNFVLNWKNRQTSAEVSFVKIFNLKYISERRSSKINRKLVHRNDG